MKPIPPISGSRPTGRRQPAKVRSAKEPGRLARLRARAEAGLGKSPPVVPAVLPHDVRKLVHELHVYQAELEMQNDELRRAELQLEGLLEISRDRFAELYDLAPVGYLTLDDHGVICEANLTASRLVGHDRVALLKKKLSRFVTASSQDVYYLHRRRVFSEPGKHTCELQMRRHENLDFTARLETILVPRTPGRAAQSLIALSDVTQQRQAEVEHTDVRRRLGNAQETERARVSRELHDQFGQELTALKGGLQLIRQDLPTASVVRHHLDHMDELSDNLMRGIQRLAWELRPPALDDFGLEAVLRGYTNDWAEQTGVPVEFRTTGLETHRLPREIETTLYRVAQEALTNVARHAKARRVSFLLQRSSGLVSLIVEDDGQGFDADFVLKSPSARGKLGLLGMKERVMLTGGTVAIESTLGSETTILVRIPLEAGHHPAS